MFLDIETECIHCDPIFLETHSDRVLTVVDQIHENDSEIRCSLKACHFTNSYHTNNTRNDARAYLNITLTCF